VTAAWASLRARAQASQHTSTRSPLTVTVMIWASSSLSHAAHVLPFMASGLLLFAPAEGHPARPGRCRIL
jgi:hypothetical protein